MALLSTPREPRPCTLGSFDAGVIRWSGRERPSGTRTGAPAAAEEAEEEEEEDDDVHRVPASESDDDGVELRPRPDDEEPRGEAAAVESEAVHF